MGGVNKGDQRAIFYLMQHFNAERILEIGTHIGCSTLSFALALLYNNVSDPHIDTVDIVDVNNERNKPWIQYKARFSPSEMLGEILCRDFVTFYKDTSLNYFKKCNDTYDLIFLDGDHSAPAVYKELPLAMELLNKNGIILLHDYFPDGRKLWPQTPPNYGPYRAIKKYIQSNSMIEVIPLGAMPWLTKYDSNNTSLAVLSRKP